MGKYVVNFANNIQGIVVAKNEGEARIKADKMARDMETKMKPFEKG